MGDPKGGNTRSDVGGDAPTRAVWPFLALTFGLSWGVLGLWLAAPDGMAGLFGELRSGNPTFLLAVYAPAISAVVLVILYGGTRAIGGFLRRFTLWRAHWGWYLLLLLGVPLAFVLGAMLKGVPLNAALSIGWGPMLSLMLLRTLTGPVEEFGWRGFLQPLLQRRMAPMWAALLVGAIWGIWHLPAFFLSGTPQSAWGFLPFLIGSVAISVIVTGMFNASSGSILLPFLMHAQLNNPIWPDAQPHDTLFFVALALIVVTAARSTMFTRDHGTTDVYASPISWN